QDFPIVCGGKGLFADLTMNEVTYDLCAGTHADHLIVRLTLWALKLLSIVHRWADIQIADVLQANPAFNLSIRNRADGSLPQRGRSRACAFVRFSNRPSGSSTFRLTPTPVSTGSRFSSDSAPRPFHHGDSKTRWNNLSGGLAVNMTAGPSGQTISPHPSSREGHHSTARW